ncbi:MAG TPA: 5'-nucleotidase C-terminal domain-containing protein [Bacteroidota bacterium]|nr:5'-nucleotidase C-terminal domain-containing protein [Bacteroidota bacterium]
MGNWFRRTLTLATVVILCAAVSFGGGTVVTIVHVNDTHSHLDAFGPKDFHMNGTIGGIAKAAAVIGSIRASEQNVVLLHGGDAFVGDFFFNMYYGVPELQLMQALGFDAMAVGNHEFDLYPSTLADALGAASVAGDLPAMQFPLLSANLVLGGSPEGTALQPFIKPSIVIDRGVKIGIFGMTVWDNPTTNSSPIAILPDTMIDCQGIVNGLRQQGAAIVICLSHMGYLHDRALASRVSGIDVIVGAHDHYLFTKPVRVTNGGKVTLILQAGAFYLNVGKLRLNVNGPHVTFVDYQMIPVDARVPAVPDIQAVVNALKAGIVQFYGDVYHKPVGVALCDLAVEYDPASQIRDTPMGDLVTDALRKKGGTQLGFSATGLINEKIYAGPIVGADVFRSFPYGFDITTKLGLKLVRVTTDAASIVTGLEAALSFEGITEDYAPQISGMTFRYNGANPVGSRVILPSIRIGGKPVDFTASYTMTVDEGLAALLPLLGIKVSAEEVMPDFEYTVVKDYIHRLGVVAYRPEGRIRDVSVKCPGERYLDEEVAEATASGDKTPAAVTAYELGQNYPNPFNPSTTISYALPVRSQVSLSVFNALGQVARVLVSGMEEAGVHEVRFDGTGLASGIYFYRLQAGSYVETRKLTLLK